MNSPLKKHLYNIMGRSENCKRWPHTANNNKEHRVLQLNDRIAYDLINN